MSAALPPLASGASARADFNGDGRSDLAVGAPKDDQGSAVDAGVVSVVYASGGVLSPTGARTFNQGHAGGIVEAGDEFGSALATGDFNGDERADLAVGTPNEAVEASPVGVEGGFKFAGVVNILYGSANGLTTTGAKEFDNEDGGYFGATLAAGDFNQDGRDDLAVGAPTFAGGTGAIIVLSGSGGGLSTNGLKQFLQSSAGGTAEADDRFGSALAAGRFNGDKKIDLAIGAIGEDVDSAIDAGAINVMYGSSGGLNGTGAREFTQKDAGGAVEAGDLFGRALAAGNFNGAGRTDLAVGAPSDDQGSAVDAGVISVLYASGNGGLSPAGAKTFNQKHARGAVEAGDGFGRALAAGNFNGAGGSDLAVGAPDDDQGSAANAGVVSVLYAASAGLSPTGAKTFNQKQVGGVVEAGDEFGFALAARSFDGNARTDLAVGSPGEDLSSITDAGFFHALYGASGGLSLSSQKFSQEKAGGTVEADDSFGRSLG